MAAGRVTRIVKRHSLHTPDEGHWYWPWEMSSFKPTPHKDQRTGRIRMLVKAAALIVAELDRMERELEIARSGDGE